MTQNRLRAAWPRGAGSVGPAPWLSRQPEQVEQVGDWTQEALRAPEELQKGRGYRAWEREAPCLEMGCSSWPGNVQSGKEGPSSDSGETGLEGPPGLGWGRPGEGWAGELVQQRERSGLGVGVGSLDFRREATGTPGVCYNPAVAPRSSHDVGTCVGQAPRSATELLQDTSQPLCTSTSPVNREHHCGPQAGRPEAHPGSNPLGRLQLMVLDTTSFSKPWTSHLHNPWGQLPLPAHPGGPRLWPSLHPSVEGV